MSKQFLRKIHKTGTEKPIEIFVALFIVLAVAMIMLKMFQSQISEKTTELKELDRKTEFQNAIADAKLTCNSACAEADVSGGCSLRAQANYCLKHVTSEAGEGLDLNANRAFDDLDSSLLGGVEVCEDGVYCPMVNECNCGKKLNMKNCHQIICDFWAQEFSLDESEQNGLLAKNFKRGTCADSDDDWVSVVFNGTLSCADTDNNGIIDVLE